MKRCSLCNACNAILHDTNALAFTRANGDNELANWHESRSIIRQIGKAPTSGGERDEA